MGREENYLSRPGKQQGGFGPTALKFNMLLLALELFTVGPALSEFES